MRRPGRTPVGRPVPDVIRYGFAQTSIAALLVAISARGLVAVLMHERADDHALEEGRGRILLDYHLRVGEITADTRVPEGQRLVERRLDETEVGEGAAVTLVDARCSEDWIGRRSPQELARCSVPR